MLVKCKYCESCFNVEPTDDNYKFENRENDFLQNECLKIEKRIDKLKSRLDSKDVSSYQCMVIGNQISALQKIQNILENYI